MIEEIESDFEKALIVNQDLRDPDCKALSDCLPALSWKIPKVERNAKFGWFENF